MELIDGETAETRPLSLAAAERAAVVAALVHTRGRKVHAARLLGCARSTLDRLIVTYQIDLEAILDAVDRQGRS